MDARGEQIAQARRLLPRWGSRPAFIAAGLVSREELARLLSDMQRIAADETVLAVMPRMSQVWARKAGCARIGHLSEI